MMKTPEARDPEPLGSAEPVHCVGLGLPSSCGHYLEQAVYFHGCTSHDKMKCVPDTRNFPIKISLSRSPVRNDK